MGAYTPRAHSDLSSFYNFREPNLKVIFLRIPNKPRHLKMPHFENFLYPGEEIKYGVAAEDSAHKGILPRQ